jgi:hypothetical protein
MANRLMLRPTLHDFSIRCLSDVAWSFAKVHSKNLVAPELETRFFDKLSRELEKREWEAAKPVDYATLLWSLTVVGYPAEPLFDKLSRHLKVKGKLSSFSERELAITASSFASLSPQLSFPVLFQEIEAQFVARERVPLRESATILGSSNIVLGPSTLNTTIL